MAQQFKHLFSPIKVGSMTVPNRIVVPGHFTGLSDLDTLPGEKLIAYWETRAKGGVGMIVSGIWAVHPSSPIPPQPGYLEHKSFMSPLQIPQGIEKLKKAAEAIKQHGTCFLIQLWHGGAQAFGTAHYGDSLWAPSTGPTRQGGSATHAMTRDEIKELIEAFAAEALRCKQAGVDGVEIHGAHGYLFTQFMSPATNRRHKLGE